MTTITAVIDGIIKTTSPLHISDVSTDRYNPKTKKLGGTGGAECTLTRRQGVLMADGSTALPPVIPATSLRGRLRRLAAELIESRLEAKLTWQAYQMLHCGATGKLTECNDLTQLRQAREDAMMGLFGGGPALLPGNLKVATALPMIAKLAELIPDDAGPLLETEPWQLTEVQPILRKDDLLKNQNAQVDAIVDDAGSYIEQQLATTAEAKKRRLRDKDLAAARKAGDADAVAALEAQSEQEDDLQRGLRTMAYVQTVKANTPFYVRFSVKGSPAQAGLLLSALHALVTSDAGLGGKGSVGFGQFTHELYLHADDQRERLFNGGDRDAHFNWEFAPIKTYLEALESALDTDLAARYNTLAAMAS